MAILQFITSTALTPLPQTSKFRFAAMGSNYDWPLNGYMPTLQLSEQGETWKRKKVDQTWLKKGSHISQKGIKLETCGKRKSRQQMVKVGANISTDTHTHTRTHAYTDIHIHIQIYITIHVSIRNVEWELELSALKFAIFKLAIEPLRSVYRLLYLYT